METETDPHELMRDHVARLVQMISKTVEGLELFSGLKANKRTAALSMARAADFAGGIVKGIRTADLPIDCIEPGDGPIGMLEEPYPLVILLPPIVNIQWCNVVLATWTGDNFQLVGTIRPYLQRGWVQRVLVTIGDDSQWYWDDGQLGHQIRPYELATRRSVNLANAAEVLAAVNARLVTAQSVSA